MQRRRLGMILGGRAAAAHSRAAFVRHIRKLPINKSPLAYKFDDATQQAGYEGGREAVDREPSTYPDCL